MNSHSPYRRFDFIDHYYPSPFFCSDYPTSTIFNPCFPPPFFHEDDLTSSTLDLLHPHPCPRPLPSAFSLLDFPSPFDLPCRDMIHVETAPFCGYSRVLRHRSCSPELYFHDRLSALESKFDRLGLVGVDRKYSWTAEIKGAVDRKYKLKAEIDGYDWNKGRRGERKYKWTAEVKGKNDQKRTYSWEATIDGEKKKKGSCSSWIPGTEEPYDHGVLALRQRKALAKRALAAKHKGKKKELSHQEAAAMIQMNYRAYLARRSQTLYDLRELAIARTKLKELRILFHNYSYCSQIVRDAEERQKFSERIIVLLLTLDTIKGIDHMVKAAKRSMVHELDAMLEWVDPQAGGRSVYTKRRTFDMPTGGIQKEIAEGVAKLVELVEQ